MKATTTKRRRRRPIKRRGISRIDQPSTRTYGWYVRAGFYRRKDGAYVPRHTRFFADLTHGGKRRALQAAKDFLAKLTRTPRTTRRAA